MRRLVVLMMAAGAAFGGVATVHNSGVPRYVETGASFLPPATAEGARGEGRGFRAPVPNP